MVCMQFSNSDVVKNVQFLIHFCCLLAKLSISSTLNPIFMIEMNSSRSLARGQQRQNYVSSWHAGQDIENTYFLRRPS